MCDPSLMIGAQAAGGGLSTVSSFFDAQQQKDNLYHQAAMAEINARIADSNARAATERGIFEETRVKTAGSRLKASQIARFAGSGVDIAGSASAQAVLAGTDVLTQADAIQVRANAVRSAWGHRLEAGDYRRSASIARASAKSISPLMAGATSLIGAATTIGQSYYGLKKQGAFDKAPKQGEVTVEAATPVKQSQVTYSAYDSLKLSNDDDPFRWAI